MKKYKVKVKSVFPVRYDGDIYLPGSELEVAEKDLQADLFDVIEEVQTVKTASKKTASSKEETAEEE